VAIADNGAYDWNPAAGKVFDPLTVTLYGEPRGVDDDANDGGKGSGSGGGCDAGLGLAGAALAAMAARRRNSR
jgi:MYXO-CTERM domain-containing protein